MLVRGHDELDIEVRGLSDHGMIESIYFRDPNGYVIVRCAKPAEHDALMAPARNGARDKLQGWPAAIPATGHETTQWSVPTISRSALERRPNLS